jgi:hypothetical protein
MEYTTTEKKFYEALSPSSKERFREYVEKGGLI